MRIFKSILKLLRLGGKSADKVYFPVYTAIVRQARTQNLYATGMAPDSFDGRFDVMVLHVYMVLRRLKKADQARYGAGQVLFDFFFRDMDQAMREMGVGDLGVGKKIKKMAESFYGRVKAYDEALDMDVDVEEAEGNNVLTDVLARNFYPQDQAMLSPKMVLYVKSLEDYLTHADIDKVLSRNIFEGFKWG